MAKPKGVEWFGADKQISNGGQTTTAVLEVPGAPKPLRVRTTSKDALISELTARYKMYREAANLASPDDRETMERRREIAYAEMQLARKEQQLANYLENPMRKNDQAPRPDQVRVYKDIISMWRGRILELTGQGD